MVPKRKKHLIFLGAIVSIVLLFLFACSLFLASFTENLLRDRLSQNPNKLYKITFEQLNFSLLKGEIELTNISMDIDTSYVDSLKLSKHYPKTLYSGTVNAIRLNGISGLDIYFNKVIRVNTLLIQQPDVNLLLTHSHDSVKSVGSLTSGGIQELLISLNDSKINSIVIENGRLTVDSEVRDNIRRIGNADLLNLEVLNFELDSSKHDHPFVVEEVKLGFENGEFDISPTYFLKLSKFNFSFKDSSLKAEQFKLIPKQTSKQFAQNNQYKKNRLDFDIPTISCSSVNFDKLMFQEKMEIGVIEIKDGNMHVSKDHSKPWPPAKRFPTPYQMAHNIPVPATIQHLNIVNTTLTTEQIMPKNEPPSILTINELNVSISNLTNDSTAMLNNSKMTVDTDLKLLGSAKLVAHGTFDLLNENQNFVLKANMKSTPLNLFNPLLQSAIHLEVATGQLNGAEIFLQGNKYEIIGTADLDYSNATIAFEQKDEDIFSKLKKNLISGLANTVLKTNNEKGSQHYKTGRISYSYNNSVPFTRSLWLAIQGGIIDTMIPFDMNRISAHSRNGQKTKPTSRTTNNAGSKKHRRHKHSK